MKETCLPLMLSLTRWEFCLAMNYCCCLYFYYACLVSALQLIEWRSTADKLKRFETACSKIVQRLLQTLVMKAVNTLKEGMRRSIKEANAHWVEQIEAFKKSKMETVSQPFSESVLDRVVIFVDVRESDEEEGQGKRHGEVEEMEAQATHFTQFVAGVDFGEGAVIRGLGMESKLDSSIMSGPIYIYIHLYLVKGHFY